MDLSTLKEALEDEKFSALETYVNGIISQRDEARNESINKRQQLKNQVQTLEGLQSQMLEKLGIDSVEDLDDLPEGKGQGEALSQLEARNKRLQRELETAQEAAKTSDERFRSSQKRVAVSDAMGAHQWIARDLVEGFITPRLEFEGDDLLFKTDEGKFISVKDGVAGLAKSRPELLEAQGARGAGVGSRGTRGANDSNVVTRAEFDAMTPQQRVEASKEGVKISSVGG